MVYGVGIFWHCGWSVVGVTSCTICWNSQNTEMPLLVNLFKVWKLFSLFIETALCFFNWEKERDLFIVWYWYIWTIFKSTSLFSDLREADFTSNRANTENIKIKYQADLQPKPFFNVKVQSLCMFIIMKQLSHFIIKNITLFPFMNRSSLNRFLLFIQMWMGIYVNFLSRSFNLPSENIFLDKLYWKTIKTFNSFSLIYILSRSWTQIFQYSIAVNFYAFLSPWIFLSNFCFM